MVDYIISGELVHKASTQGLGSADREAILARPLAAELAAEREKMCK